MSQYGPQRMQDPALYALGGCCGIGDLFTQASPDIQSEWIGGTVTLKPGDWGGYSGSKPITVSIENIYKAYVSEDDNTGQWMVKFSPEIKTSAYPGGVGTLPLDAIMMSGDWQHPTIIGRLMAWKWQIGGAAAALWFLRKQRII